MAAASQVCVNPGENKAPSSPQLPRETVDSVKSSEQSGVPLNTPWTFWIDKSVRGATAAEYEALLRKIYTVNTVQGFWSVYNYIRDVDMIQNRNSYHLMRHERKPLWEDACHCRGGNWRFKCAKRDTPLVWKELLLAVIGEQLSDNVHEGDEISGVSVSVRERDDIVQLWNVDSLLANSSTVVQRVEELLPSVNFFTSFYKAFQTHEAFEGAKR